LSVYSYAFSGFRKKTTNADVIRMTVQMMSSGWDAVELTEPYHVDFEVNKPAEN
jgi:hypothetical protein